MPQTFNDVPCTVCGCVCDDLRVTFSGQRLTHVDRACHLAEAWFDSLREPPLRPAAAIDGQSVQLGQAVERAAEILRHSRAPLIWGLSRSSTAGQRVAVRLAEQIGASIDTTASVRHGPSIMAMQEVGMSTCSLGEVRNRADLVIFWGADPVETHPRHFERYSVDAKGLFVPRGRADRKVIVIDSDVTATSQLADTFLKIPRDSDFEIIGALRQLLRGIDIPASVAGGVTLAELRELATQMKSCRYGSMFFGNGLSKRGIGRKNVEALFQLVAELNEFTRFTAGSLGGLSGAEAVLCWMTGFPFAVNFARGYPRYGPGEYTANELLERGQVDACLLVGSEACGELSTRARRTLDQIPTIALDYPNVNSAISATVQISTAIYGIHAAGTAYRMDEVPIPLRRLVVADLPTDDEVLSAFSERVHGSA